MDSILYMRIKELCKKTDITIAELERTLGFGFKNTNYGCCRPL